MTIRWFRNKNSSIQSNPRAQAKSSERKRGKLRRYLLEMLEPTRSLRPVNALNEGAYAFERIEKTRLARVVRDSLLQTVTPEPLGIPAQLRKDLAEVKLRLPHIAELIHQLKNDEKLPFKRIPLTVGDARREIIEMMNFK